MSSASAIDFQIANTANLEKIERFMNAAAYQENIEYSSNFNTRLCIERRLRLPFFDPQTGVAQNHCSLFMARGQRMPGFRDGQIYSYPAARWRKHRRQYLSKMLRPFSSIGAINPTPAQINGGPSSNHHLHRRFEYANTEIDTEFNGSQYMEENSSLGGAGDTSDSKDSQQIKEELPKEWFYDEFTTEIDGIEEPKSPVDDEYDYDPRYGNKKRRKRRAPSQKLQQRSLHHMVETTPKKRQSSNATGSRRGRRKTATSGKNNHSREPPSPPSFESAAAAVEQANDDSLGGDMRNYRKYM